MKRLRKEKTLTLDDEIIPNTTPLKKSNLNKKRERIPEDEENKTYFFRKKIKTKYTISVKEKNNDNINKLNINTNINGNEDEDSLNGLDSLFDRLSHISLSDTTNTNADNITEKILKENIDTNNITKQSCLTQVYTNNDDKEKEREIINSNKNNRLIFFPSLNKNKIKYKFIGKQKIDLILDIDQTLLFTRINPSNNLEILSLDETNPDNIYTAQFKSNSKEMITINYQIQLRSALKSFLEAMNKYCNLYINTHSQENYAKKVIKIISNKTGILIPNENIIASKSHQEFKLKSIGDLITNDNYLILDDSLCAWESKYHHHIIPSMKYQGFLFTKKISQGEIYETHYQYLLSNSIPYDINEIDNELLDENNVLVSMETDQSDKCQLDYLKTAIEKAYYLSLIYKQPIYSAFYYLRSLVLNQVRVYLSLRHELKLVNEIVTILGGTITNDINKSTHVIYNNLSERAQELFNKNNKNKGSSDNKDIANIYNYYKVNLKWLFHCYFYIEKMNENNAEYSI